MYKKQNLSILMYGEGPLLLDPEDHTSPVAYNGVGPIFVHQYAFPKPPRLGHKQCVAGFCLEPIMKPAIESTTGGMWKCKVHRDPDGWEYDEPFNTTVYPGDMNLPDTSTPEGFFLEKATDVRGLANQGLELKIRYFDPVGYQWEYIAKMFPEPSPYVSIIFCSKRAEGLFEKDIVKVRIQGSTPLAIKVGG